MEMDNKFNRSIINCFLVATFTSFIGCKDTKVIDETTKDQSGAQTVAMEGINIVSNLRGNTSIEIDGTVFDFNLNEQKIDSQMRTSNQRTMTDVFNEAINQILTICNERNGIDAFSIIDLGNDKFNISYQISNPKIQGISFDVDLHNVRKYDVPVIVLSEIFKNIQMAKAVGTDTNNNKELVKLYDDLFNDYVNLSKVPMFNGGEFNNKYLDAHNSISERMTTIINAEGGDGKNSKILSSFMNIYYNSYVRSHAVDGFFDMTIEQESKAMVTENGKRAIGIPPNNKVSELVSIFYQITGVSSPALETSL